VCVVATVAMRKAVVAILLVAGLCCLASGAKECSALLNCKECEDEVHCKSCDDGYVLDDDKVCRFNCAAKFGVNCKTCSQDKCFCRTDDQEWDMQKGECVYVPKCTTKACDYCGKNFNLIDIKGKCNTCAGAFGAGCSNCSWSRCLAVEEGYTLCGAISVSEESSGASCLQGCAESFPGCKTCNEDGTACTECVDGAQLADGACQFLLNETCPTGSKLVFVNGELKCGDCKSLDAKCGFSLDDCSRHGCDKCTTGFAPNAEGKCLNCTSIFDNCATCISDHCTRCPSYKYVLTPNGCVNQNDYEVPTESNAGLIAGIVVACVVLVAIIIVAVYCIVTNTAKKGQVDPSVYEDDFEFKSMTVL